MYLNFVGSVHRGHEVVGMALWQGLLEGGGDAPPIVRVVSKPQLRRGATLFRRHFIEPLRQRTAVVPHLRARGLVEVTCAVVEQRRLAGVEEMSRVHLRHLMPGLRELQEEQRRFVRLLFAELIGVHQLAGNPLPALADLLQEVHGDVAVAHGAYAVQVHDREGVRCGRVPAVQGLRVVEDCFLEALLRACACEVHAGKVEHAV
mmetsp:Transcript_113180/g.315121  ORF Transcript_113180/g.315121 Transcript_113180/m.315121 type:complete len:204 (-) Transcript_113180:1223-1834(-)